MEEDKDWKRGVIAWFAQNPVAANLLMMGLIVMGGWTAFSIRKEVFPTVSLDSIRIEVAYLGAAPQEVEEGVCVKIEEAIQDVEGIKKITTHAYEGLGSVRVELENGYSIDKKLDEVKSRVDAITTFPNETEKPMIYEEILRSEVLWLILLGDMDERSLKELGHQIRDELLATTPSKLDDRSGFLGGIRKFLFPLSKVTQADLWGEREYEVSIELSESALQEYGVSFDEVVQAVRKTSLDVPGGSIRTSEGEILLRTKGQAYEGPEFERIVLMTREDGTRILLGDVAQVHDGFEDRVAINEFDGKPALGIQIFGVGDQNTLNISRTIHRFVEMKKAELPHGVELVVWADNSIMLKQRLDMMSRNAVAGGVLVFLALALFLRLKLALWVMMGIPVCFLGTFWVMTFPQVDISLNMVSLFGFIIVLGIVVDDAIVIGENVFTVTRRDGNTLENVIKGANEVAMAATFGVLTTMVAFLPMLMVPGVEGKIWSQIGLVIIVCLCFSLVESKLILPAHLARMKVQYHREGKVGWVLRTQRWVNTHLEWFVESIYRPLMKVAIHYRYVTGSVFIALCILSVGLLTSAKVPWVFFPDVPVDFVHVNVVMNEGTPSALTQETAFRIEAAMREVDREMVAKKGPRGASVEHTLVMSHSENRAEAMASLLSGESRLTDTFEFVRLLREKTGQMPGVSELEFSGSTGGSGEAINFQLVGRDFGELDSVADAIKAKLGEYAGVYDIKDSFSSGKQELRFRIKPEAESLGLGLDDMARQVRYAFYGAEAQRIQRGKHEVRVMVRYPEADRRSLDTLKTMRVRTPDGREVPLEAVADLELAKGYPTVRRVDRKRVVNVTADVDKAKITPGSVIEEMRAGFIPELLRQHPGVSYEMEGESKSEQESLDAALKGFILALFLIFALMAVPLKSYLKPLVIMAVIPFGMVGAVAGHWIMGMPMSLLSLCGIIALAGVVVNDSLVMVDFINQRESQGMTHTEAVLNAGPARFRAIILTSATTFFGLLPMLWEPSFQAKFLKPMAVSLAFGILFSTAMTLVLVPALYMMLEDLKLAGRWFRRLLHRGGAEAHPE